MKEIRKKAMGEREGKKEIQRASCQFLAKAQL